MLTRFLAVTAAAVLGIVAAPVVQAEPEFCLPHNLGHIYISACVNGNGGGGPDPFFARLHDPVTGEVVKNPTTGKTIKVCKSACSGLSPGELIQND